jgi:hypothetical protein
LFYRDVISGQTTPAGFIISIIGALILLFIWGKMNPDGQLTICFEMIRASRNSQPGPRRKRRMKIS